ncbi:response regulator [Actinomadura alba]|uniref:Response regulator transcription factor n=1 Tax=Actinomadura alba TaxID=406431 RepID=A0ABR7LMW2_9ACTN|nr:response regulator transcription factor [Actinomadura alba]MBC6466076.1 response regulator transcription factor [Actinomadura alba]
MAIRCLLIDDSRHFLEAARHLLEQEGISVVGTASTGTEAVCRAEELRPELVLLDICLGGDCGLELAHLLTQVARTTPPQGSWRPSIILTSTHAEEDYADLIADSDAVGFLSKPALSADAIRALLASGAIDAPATGRPYGPGASPVRWF